MDIKEEIELTKDMNGLEFCKRIASTTIWSLPCCIDLLKACKNDRELFLNCYDFSIYNAASPYKYLSAINTPKNKFNNGQVEINIIRGNAEDLKEDIDKAKVAITKTLLGIFRKPPKKPIKQLFIKFLKKEEVIERYKRNWLFCDWYANYRPLKKREWYVLKAFLWTSSPEGHGFWRDIDNKWLKYLESIGRQR